MPEILDPPEQLPADVRPGVPLDQLAGAGKWAQRFQPSDASFAQRFRHNRDIREYGEALQAQKAAAIEAQARTNAQAQSFYFRSKELDLKERAQAQKLQQDHEMFPKKLTLIESQIATTGAREKRMADESIKTEADTKGLEEHLGGMLALQRQSPEWKTKLAEGLSTYSHADPARIKAAGTMLFPKEDLTPEEILERAHQLRDAGLGGRVSSTGTISATVPVAKPENPTLKDDRAYYARRVNELRTQLGTAKADMKPGLTADLNDTWNKLQQTEAKISDAPAAPTVDKAAIAKKALNDPNASEAHKAAARKILGL